MGGRWGPDIKSKRYFANGSFKELTLVVPRVILPGASAEMLPAANDAGIERLATGLLRVMAATRTFPFSCETPSTGLKGGDRAG